MTSLELVLLGGFQVRAAGQAIDVSGRKERALLAVLAMPPGEPRSRDKLAGLLWSDRGDKQARDSLKQAVLRLRKSFGTLHPLPIVPDRASLTLDAAEVAVDVQEFEQLIGNGTPDAVARAATLYRGDLLDGLDVRDPAFEEWLLFERQRLRDLARAALARLLELHMASDAHDQAGAAARRLLALDPLQESAHRALMRIYAEHGQTALALRQYQMCRDALLGELGVRPDAETERLYQSIREKRGRRTDIQVPPAEASDETSSLFDPPPLLHDREAAIPSARPSIAVLPFENLSDDPEQQYFSDGITEDIITALSRVKWLFVIARNSSFTYKGRTVDVTHVARELGVRYVLEGSVRKAGGRVRITGQLIQAEIGQHIWADKFDGELADVFELQDQITASVVAAVEPSLRQAEIERARRKPTERLDAYDYYLRALPHFYTLTRAGIDEALVLLDRAATIDPHFALAKALAARGYAWRNPQGWAAAPEQEKTIAVRLGREALQDGADNPTVLWMVGFMMWQLRVDPEGALELYDKSLAINPNSAQALTMRGWALASVGRHDDAIASLLQALRLSPFDPEAFFTLSAMGFAYLMTGRFDDAVKWTSRALRERPTFAPALRFHAIGLVELGRLGEARETVAHLLQLEPGLTISTVRARAPIFDAKLMNAFLGGLRKAGLPE
jgi:TolB-like protein/DNA-binding SARP family transcriptional activator/cytochrome c-type biogenesis protein CcmH/NrfG